MKTLLLSLITLFVIALHGSAQSPALVAGFGVDGELSNDTLRSGSGTSGGSHDWFKQKAGTGIGLVDTSGASYFKPLIAAGSNITFTRGQSIARFSIVDNMYMLDTRYGRDGLGSSGQMVDSTMFKNSNKNGGNPENWGFEPTGGGVQHKNDIVDIYAHMRRNGTTINATNPSPLYLFAGASTLGVDGDRYIDFELYKSRVSFSRVTGFSNSGPSTTGGHSQWTFNADGTVKSTGDMMLSFSYSSSSVSDVAVYIWVSKTAKNSINPLYFDFIPAEFYGDGFNPDYGYCRITQNNGLPNFEFSATTNTFNSDGPFWGTNSKELAGTGTNNASTMYGSGQLSEVAINLTSLGIDPALGNAGTTTDPCAPPFTRLMVKTRASNSFTAELKDFTGPYPFLDAPQVPQQIKPANLTCVNNTTTLEPLYPQAGAHYEWSTVGGNILTNPISQSITVSGEGKYYLTASIVTGCSGLTDSIILTRDTYQPVATATVSGIVNSYFPQQMATLKGGDTVLSNYFTPFGSSAGLAWSWTGPNGFNPATTINAQTNIEGKYTLIVTELRNGCKDTAEVQVVSAQTLPVKMESFTATLNNIGNKVDLKWTTSSEINVNHFIVEKSTDGSSFIEAGMVFAYGTASEKANYTFADNITGNQAKVIYYRLRSIDIDGKNQLSETRLIRIGNKSENAIAIVAYPNPVINELRITVPANWQNKKAFYEIISASGQVAKRVETGSSSQTENINVSSLAPGIYFVKVSCNNEIAQQRIVKQ